MDKIVVVGQGYVGLPLAVAVAEKGRRVIGLDIDQERVAALIRGRSHIADISSERLAAVLAAGTYVPTCDPSDADGFDIAVVTAPTPLDAAHTPDLTWVRMAAADLGRRLRPGCLVILESTSFPGTTEEVVAPILAAESGLRPGEDFDLGFSPERIDPGNAHWTLETTPKVVSATSPESLARVREFYEIFLEHTVEASNPRVAELAKVFENTFRQVNIALVNELTMHARRLGIDAWEALDIAGTKPFGFMRFSPGPGVGGHCLPIDPMYLAWKVQQDTGHPFRIVELAQSINDSMPAYVVERIAEGLARRGGALLGARVLVLGLSYKPDIADIRESPAVAVCALLVQAGAQVSYVDELVGEKPEPAGLTPAELTEAELAAADVVVVLADHNHLDYDFVAEHARYVFDTRRRLPGRAGVETL